jgi:succinate dehydrogenase flavin-adding protein (antitoxin of CptAB toxin-antitoxin module)
MQELDILLLRYVKSCESRLPADRLRELALIEQFLGLQDPELQRYLLAGERPENPAWAALVERIRATTRVL